MSTEYPSTGVCSMNKCRGADDREDTGLRVEYVDPRTECDRDEDGRVVGRGDAPDPSPRIYATRPGVAAPHDRQEQHEPADHEEQVNAEVRAADKSADRAMVENRRTGFDPGVKRQHHQRGHRS